MRTVCLEFFGNARDAVPSIVEIKDFMFAEQKRRAARPAGRPGTPGRPLPEGGRLRDQDARRGGLPKMVLVGDIVGDDADAVARATREVVRLANSRSGEGFVAISPEARKKFWLDRKRTAAISKHTNAFKINEDVVIPLPRMARIHRRHRAHQHRAVAGQQARAGRRAGGLLRPRQPAAGPAATTPARSPRPNCWKTACSRRSRCCARCARSGSDWLGERRRALFPQLQDHTLRASWKTQIRAPLQSMFAGAAPSAHPGRDASDPPAGAQGPRLGGAAHACRRRQRAHQHPGQQRQLRDAADGARGGEAHHGAGAFAGWRDLGRARHRHHQAGVPERRGARAVRRLQAEGRPGRPLQQGQAAARRAPPPAGPTRTPLASTPT